VPIKVGVAASTGTVLFAGGVVLTGGAVLAVPSPPPPPQPNWAAARTSIAIFLCIFLLSGLQIDEPAAAGYHVSKLLRYQIRSG
jgi:hypothetical protein